MRQLCVTNVRLVLINQAKKNNAAYKNSGILFVKQTAPEQPTTDRTPTRVTLSLKGTKLASKDLMGVSGRI